MQTDASLADRVLPELLHRGEPVPQLHRARGKMYSTHVRIILFHEERIEGEVGTGERASEVDEGHLQLERRT